MCPRLSNYQQHESCQPPTPPSQKNPHTKLGLKILGPATTGTRSTLQPHIQFNTEREAAQQARYNGCILPASTAPLDNVMCQYTALNCTNKLHPLWSMEMAQKCVTHSAERGCAPFTIRVAASRYN